MNLSDHFTLEEATFSETAARLGVSNQPSSLQLENMKYAAQQLEKVRELTGPLKVYSWLRLPAVNAAVPGSSGKSSHMDGWAIDVKSSTYTPIELCHIAMKSGVKFDQIIHEFGAWMHISFAPEMRQQTLTTFAPEKKYKHGILTEAEYHAA